MNRSKTCSPPTIRTTRLNADYVACCLFFLSALWYTLFPLISITTGETKPRGFYVDENALLARNGPAQLLPLFNIDKSHRDIEHFKRTCDSIWRISKLKGDLCTHLTGEFSSVSCRLLSKSSGSITEIIVDHPWKSRSLEITVVVIPYHSSNELQSFSFASTLLSRLVRSDWMSKRVTILLVPLRCGKVDNFKGSGDICDSVAYDGIADRIRYSSSLALWLKNYHASQFGSNLLSSIPTHSNISAMGSSDDFAPLEGLLRDAYIVDFSEAFITTRVTDSSTKTGGGKSVPSKARLSWKKVQLSVVGNNGQLPNMDFLSAPMAAFMGEAMDEGDALPESVAAHRDNDSQTQSPSFAAVLSSGLCGWSSLFFSARLCEQYFQVLSGLINFTGALIEGPSGLHGQFIRRNIDSLSLRPMARIPSRRLSRSSLDGDDTRHTAQDGAVRDLVNLVDMVEGCVRFSSNLHGKQHRHSFCLWQLSSHLLHHI